MLLPNLMKMIETHAEELTREVLSDLEKNPRTPFFHRIPPEELRRRIYDVYHNLGRWLEEKDETRIEGVYSDLGRRRSAESMPADQLVYAILRTKEHLWDFIHRNHGLQSAVELYQEEELIFGIGRFFDKAVYFTVKGYHSARAVSSSAAGRAI